MRTGAAPIQVVVRAGWGMTRALPGCPDIWIHTGGACRVVAQAGGLRAVRGCGALGCCAAVLARESHRLDSLRRSDLRRRRRWPWTPALHTSEVRGKQPGM